VITDQEILDEGKRIFEVLGQKVGTYKEFPSSMILFRQGGERIRVPIDHFAGEFGQDPGTIVKTLLPLLRKDKQLMGMLFFSEGWSLKGNIKQVVDMSSEAKEDLEKVMRGEMSVSDSQFKQECLMVNVETRSGRRLHFMREIVHDQNGKRSMGEEQICFSEKDHMTGKTIGFFEDPPPMPTRFA